MWWTEEKSAEQVQRSKEWFEYRGRHIGASQVPAIMGTCDFRTAKNIFDDKMGQGQEEGNGATARGISLEPLIILKFEELKKVRLTQPVLEYPEWPVLSASLDGWIESTKEVVEVKAPAFWKHSQAHCGLVPETYEDQVQAQLLVTGSDLCWYVSYHPDMMEEFQLAVVPVPPNKERQSLILKRCQEFWEMVKRGSWDDSKGFSL